MSSDHAAASPSAPAPTLAEIEAFVRETLAESGCACSKACRGFEAGWTAALKAVLSRITGVNHV